MWLLFSKYTFKSKLFDIINPCHGGYKLDEFGFNCINIDFSYEKMIHMSYEFGTCEEEGHP